MFVERGRTVCVCGVHVVVWPVRESLKSAHLYWYVCLSHKKGIILYTQVHHMLYA